MKKNHGIFIFLAYLVYYATPWAQIHNKNIYKFIQTDKFYICYCKPTCEPHAVTVKGNLLLTTQEVLVYRSL